MNRKRTNKSSFSSSQCREATQADVKMDTLPQALRVVRGDDTRNKRADEDKDDYLPVWITPDS